MVPRALDDADIRRELERVLASSLFERSVRLSRLLRFVVEKQLSGYGDELKETILAVEVFGRSPDYNPRRDAIVRTEAGRLRGRLSEYYLGDGARDPIMIEVPKGGYVPSFRRIETAPPEVTEPALAPAGSRVPLVAVIAIAVVAITGLTWWMIHRNTRISIAVLPFENLSHDPAEDYLADGLSDELIRTLSTFTGVAPRSRTSSFALKGKSRSAREAGAELGVDYLVEGSVLRSGEQLRVDAQLVRVPDDAPVWSGKFERRNSDVFTIQDEIARAIVNNLPVRLGPSRKRREINPEAYDAYLRAQALVTGEGLPAYERSVSLYEAAIDKDPTFAAAWAGEAEVYMALSGTFPRLTEQKSRLEKMRAAAVRAIQLDPLSPEANDAAASVYARDGKWQESERSFRRAIELNPNSSTTRGDFAMYLLMPLGRFDEAIRELRIAERSDPLSAEVQDFIAFGFMLERRYGEAASHCANLPADYRGRPECLGRALLAQGRTTEAIQVLAELCCRGNRGYLGYAYARAGDTAEARKLLAKLAPNPFNEALVYAGLGDKQRTLDALERMAVLGPVRVGRELAFPEFAAVRDDPRISALRKRVGLPN
jgi:TolB-like protein/tetratricopeptide (TPR) repeat protein